MENVEIQNDMPVTEGQTVRTEAADAKSREKLVDFKDLVPHPNNPRLPGKYLVSGPAGGKARSIYQHGLLNPLTVSPQPDGTYLILQGHLRYFGIKLIREHGLPPIGRDSEIAVLPDFMGKVKCRVVEGLSKQAELDLMMDHGSTTPLEEREYYLAAKELYRGGFSESAIAERLGFSSRNKASILIRIARMPQCVEARFLSDANDLTHEKINALSKVYNDELSKGDCGIKEAGPAFQEAWEAYENGETVAKKKTIKTADFQRLAELESDPDLRDLLISCSKGNLDKVAESLERLRIRLGQI